MLNLFSTGGRLDLSASMSDERGIRWFMQDGGFSKFSVEKITLLSASPSAKEAALGFVQGGSVYDEVRMRKPDKYRRNKSQVGKGTSRPKPIILLNQITYYGNKI